MKCVSESAGRFWLHVYHSTAIQHSDENKEVTLNPGEGNTLGLGGGKLLFSKPYLKGTMSIPSTAMAFVREKLCSVKSI